MRRTGTCVLVLCVLVFAGSAYAGNSNENGNDKGNGNGGVAADAAAPGNSANAPGQVKKDEAPPAPAASTTTTVAVTSTPATPAAPEANVTGVKPSNTTAHETHAEAQSDKTKQYGNGQTAGQIAEKNGAAKNTVLHGPGNSQPHKATPCAGGHEVDVHALRNRRSEACGSSNRPSDPVPVPDPGPTPKPKPNDRALLVTTTTQSTGEGLKQDSSDSAAQGEAKERAGEVASSSAGDEGLGVLSRTEAIGRVATLPFTGQPLWAVVLAGLVLVATGLGLRQIRTVGGCVQSGHDHTDRSRHDSARARRPFGGRAG
jgi:hypothetical protein